MSISREKKEEIKRYILRHIQSKDKNYVSKTVETYEISRTTVYKYLKQLELDGAISTTEDDGFKYSLVSENEMFSFKIKDMLEEDRIFNRDIVPLIQQHPRNVFEIWRYAFTEMMNNAIEHANAENIRCIVSVNALSTIIFIWDNGVGIFNKIRDYYSQSQNEEITLDDAVAMLFAGKFTTDKSHHSGEGIFFTSRALDEFFIFSQDKVFTHDVFNENLFNIAEIRTGKVDGTLVVMELENESKKDLKEIMDIFTDCDKGFFKTQLPIAHIFPNKYPVSRSEARRLGTMITRFTEVTLDFEGVEGVGQGFTNELFVVFKNQNPEIKLEVINATDNVAAMIKRVSNTN